MAVGILIVAHEQLAGAMARVAEEILGGVPVPLRTVGVARDCPLESIREQLRLELAELDRGDGVLVLTDLYGSTPSNLAASVVDGERARLVSGVNLPMLLRVLNYPSLGLSELAGKAISGGRDGVLACTKEAS